MSANIRTDVKRLLARAGERAGGERGDAALYHRVGGGSRDELDVSVADFNAQLDVIAGRPVAARRRRPTHPSLPYAFQLMLSSW